MNIYIETFGCQMNVEDSGRISRMLESGGHLLVSNPEEAECLLLNTCSIRDSAVQRALGRLGQWNKFKLSGIARYIGVCGCLAQHDGSSIVERMNHVDFAIGTSSYGDLVRVLESLESGEKNLVALDDFSDESTLWKMSIGNNLLPAHKNINPYPQFLSIMRGCNNRCTYCIVPYVRGPEIYRKPEDVLAEVKILVDNGYKEVTLVGQNVNSYKYNDFSFAGLIAKACETPGLLRLRFMTLHPKDVSTELIKVVNENPVACRHFHLPIQSGSDNVLRMMGRGYTRKRYLDLLAEIREKTNCDDSPEGVTITSDLMVGFPGETEDDYNDTLEMMDLADWDGIFAFKYSKRTGTPAATWENQVPDEVKTRRLSRVIEKQHQICNERNVRLIGKTLEVMVESVKPETVKSGDCESDEVDSGIRWPDDPGIIYQGRTEGNRYVFVKGEKSVESDIIGSHKKVKIGKATSYTLFGTEES